jgi:hypothetical protein
MLPAVPRSDALRREQAFLALLLLVGAGAIGVGLFELYRTNATSVGSVFDLALGASVLLVTWLFLAPAAIPEFFGDPRPGELPVRRPYLEASQLSSAPVPRTTHRTGGTAPAIPKWADPLVHPRADGPIRPAAHHFPRTAAAAGRTSPSEELPVQTAAPRPDPGPADRTGPNLADPTETPEETPRAFGGVGSNEMIAELDRIEAELRAFVPMEPVSSSATAAPADTYDDEID